MLLLDLKALNGQTPAYICDLLTPSEHDGCLRSSDRALRLVSKSRLVTTSAVEIPAWGKQTQCPLVNLFLRKRSYLRNPRNYFDHVLYKMFRILLTFICLNCKALCNFALKGTI